MVKNILYYQFFFLLISTLLISCNNEYKKYNEFIKDSMFNNNQILDEKFYIIQDIDYKTRIIYSELGTYFGIKESPTGKILFHLKYWTEVIPIKTISLNGNIWVNVKTNDNRIGWIESHFVEIKRMKNWRVKMTDTKFEDKR